MSLLPSNLHIYLSNEKLFIHLIYEGLDGVYRLAILGHI